MKDFIEDISPENYRVEYDSATSKAKVSLEFVVNEEEQIEIQLEGQLHRNEKGEVGVEWSRVEGNDFWLASVEKNLNESLSILA